MDGFGVGRVPTSELTKAAAALLERKRQGDRTAAPFGVDSFDVPLISLLRRSMAENDKRLAAVSGMLG
ncbi:hypothetical protein [Paraburkholderia acidiphila]|uniref:Uncharacterized protein n=1 Tax=Paraburkholderia acidiphila TaxID=2571747 RepID=A0A7Z2G868_9BURK|nr:hypothetical protein [Paraburkholderia acidiphila]QGZ57001.1 hypothetical protein FAZ97_18835 [Paraburkholderia acidiphila]